ncbi:MAG: hypothetical protein ACRC4M_02815 [Mycoplasma sp.]
MNSKKISLNTRMFIALTKSKLKIVTIRSKDNFDSIFSRKPITVENILDNNGRVDKITDLIAESNKPKRTYTKAFKVADEPMNEIVTTKTSEPMIAHKEVKKVDISEIEPLSKNN